MQGSEGFPEGTVPVKGGEILAGKYRVDRVLGVGGMGVVVAATHLQLDQKVAIKLMLPQALGSPGLVERFAREARAAARLKSEHVARVLDVGALDSGSPYMVMEYLDGSDLGSVLELQGPMRIDTAVDYLLQACDAVAEAHAIGIVHRDIKPRNLFLTRRNDGRALVKVLDFGIAKHMSGTDLTLTSTTDVIGSPSYMSPEQLRAARSADARSDVWGLGVVLYELLTSRLPFDATTVTELIAMVLSENPRPIHGLRADVPVGLARVIDRCLEKAPAARFPSVAELALALDPFAPAEARDLVRRISRITAGTKPSSVAMASGGDGARAAGSTSANWSAKAVRSGTRFGRRAAVIVASVVVLGAMTGGFVLRRPSGARAGSMSGVDSIEPRSVGSETAAATPPALPVLPTSPAPPTAQPPGIAEATVTAAATIPISVRLLSVDAGRAARPHHEAPSAPATSASASESPPYRTTW
jgi:eukaryotic-like serine/threonine-protein kinase